ncbi:MAG: YqeG family HAD IIIA-type phosphatase [Clostridia bacterium]
MKNRILELEPDFSFLTLEQIPLTLLVQEKIKALILDLDNTITLWNFMEVSQQVTNWIGSVKQADIAVYIISNNSAKRVEPVARLLALPYIYFANKPSIKGLLKVQDQLELASEQIAMIGDQIFTDILAGKRAGFRTILLAPLGKHEFFGTKISRLGEKILKRIWEAAR